MEFGRKGNNENQKYLFNVCVWRKVHLRNNKNIMAFDFFPLNVFFSSLKTSVSNQIDGLTINKSDYSVLTKSLICSDCNEE